MDRGWFHEEQDDGSDIHGSVVRGGNGFGSGGGGDWTGKQGRAETGQSAVREAKSSIGGGSGIDGAGKARRCFTRSPAARFRRNQLRQEARQAPPSVRRPVRLRQQPAQ